MSSHIEVYGETDPKFESIIDVFKQNFEKHNEVGASFAVFIDDKFVVDIWGGYANPEKTKLWNKDSIAKVYSTNKIINAICALMLVDRDLLDLNAPVAKYWPEFAQSGKEKVLVRHCFSHCAGLPGFGEQITVEDLKDWEKIVDILARQKPWWAPGTKMGYHATTMYYLLGELVKRISGKSISQFFWDEIGEPFNIDYHIMLPEKFRKNYADIIPPVGGRKPGAGEDINKESVAYKVWSNPGRNSVHDNDPVWFDIETRGFGNARSVARIGSIIACGGKLDGVKILSPATIAKTLEEQIFDTDLVLGGKIRYGLGWALNTDSLPYPTPNVAYWGGAGGSSLTMDLDHKMSIAYVMNQMQNPTKDEVKKNRFKKDSRANNLVEKVYEILSK